MRDFQQALQELKGKIYKKVAPLEAVCGVTSEPVPYADREKLVFRRIGIGEKWGNLWDCAWFRFTGELPSSCSLRDAALRIDLSGEGLLYAEDGVPLRGITNVDSEFDRTHGYPGKRVVPFAELGLGRKVDVWADCGCNDLFGKDCGGVLLQAEIVVCDHALRRLYYDATVLENLAASEGEEGLSRLDELFAAIARGEYAAAQSVASALLAQRGGAEKVFTACGHAHLDLAWLWPLRETKRKAERTFATALRMMERYPAYIAGFSQPQQFEWVKEHAPALYEQIRTRVAEGRLEPQGALWVEPDTNVTGGESLVRQCMYGRAFFGREFGKMPTVAHLPDCFGFSAALPQIFSQCGVDKMVTIKLSWNRYNRFPHTTFRWKGIDGSEILVHMPPEGTYNSAASPAALRRACENDREAGRVKTALPLYGIGDGGGGPGPEHIERLLREADLKGLPRVEFGTEEGFFGKLAAEHPPLKSYRGDLYLEKHQGTYTTRFYNKRHNRIMERLLADAEYLLCCAHVREGAAYPRAALEKLWKETLLYQFHDILPGSSIKRVYDECEVRYPMLEAELTELAETATQVTGVYAPRFTGYDVLHAETEKQSRGVYYFDVSEYLDPNGGTLYVLLQNGCADCGNGAMLYGMTLGTYAEDTVAFTGTVAGGTIWEGARSALALSLTKSAYEDVASVSVNGESLAQSDYTVSDDALTLSAAYMASLSAGEYTLTAVSDYADTRTFSASFTVTEDTLLSVALESAPNKLTYSPGETLDLTGGVLTVTYEGSGVSQVPMTDAAVTVSATAAQQEEGTQTVMVSYGGMSATFTITVEAQADPGTGGEENGTEDPDGGLPAGAIAGMIGGGSMVFIWNLFISKLGGIWDIYELLPAFLFSCLCIVVTSLLTAPPSQEIQREFDEVRAGI